MIFLLGDLHGNPDFPGWQEYCSRPGKDETVILLGDIRLMESQLPNNEAYSEAILSSSKTVLIVDGNHENFEFLNACPEENWKGGKVHRLSENVMHLQRGYVYTIDGKKFFVFGGTAPQITEEELARGYENLKKYDYRVDYILTHDYYKRRCPENTNPFEVFMDFLDEKVEFSQWYCGHHHKNQSWDEKHTIVYDRLTSI